VPSEVVVVVVGGGDQEFFEVSADVGELGGGGEVLVVGQGAEVRAVRWKLRDGGGADVVVAPEPERRVALGHARAPHPRRRRPPGGHARQHGVLTMVRIFLVSAFFVLPFVGPVGSLSSNARTRTRTHWSASTATYPPFANAGYVEVASFDAETLGTSLENASPRPEVKKQKKKPPDHADDVVGRSRRSSGGGGA